GLTGWPTYASHEPWVSRREHSSMPSLCRGSTQSSGCWTIEFGNISSLTLCPDVLPSRTFSRAQVDRLDFRILIRNAIGEQRRGPLPIRDDEAQSAVRREDTVQTPRSRIKHWIKRAIRFMLTPVKPAARYAREFLIGHVQATVEILRAENTALLNET